MKSTAFAIGALALLLSGCTGWEDFRNEQMAKYAGKPVDQMYAEWGAPWRHAPIVGGGVFLQFSKLRYGAECDSRSGPTPPTTSPTSP